MNTLLNKNESLKATYLWWATSSLCSKSFLIYKITPKSTHTATSNFSASAAWEVDYSSNHQLSPQLSSWSVEYWAFNEGNWVCRITRKSTINDRIFWCSMTVSTEVVSSVRFNGNSMLLVWTLNRIIHGDFISIDDKLHAHGNYWFNIWHNGQP